jgi:hypothetical protein
MRLAIALLLVSSTPLLGEQGSVAQRFSAARTPLIRVAQRFLPAVALRAKAGGAAGTVGQRVLPAVALRAKAGSAARSVAQPDSRRVAPAERSALRRLMTRAVQGQQTGDRWVRFTPHFMKGADGRTYVPFTLTLDDRAGGFQTCVVHVRVVERSFLSSRFRLDAYGYRDVFEDVYVRDTQPLERSGRVLRGALAVRPGRYDVFIGVRERHDAARSPRMALLRDSIDVPDFDRKGLRLSSVLVVDRIEKLREDLSPAERAAHPYAFGSSELIPAEDASFTAAETLTVAFIVYNPATFVDGKPDVEVDYTVLRSDTGKIVGATTPQLFDVESLPEEFSISAGHHLTPVQQLPLSQFEPGAYKLRIEVQDHLGQARAQAEVPFTVTR